MKNLYLVSSKEGYVFVKDEGKGVLEPVTYFPKQINRETLHALETLLTNTDNEKIVIAESIPKESVVVLLTHLLEKYNMVDKLVIPRNELAKVYGSFGRKVELHELLLLDAVNSDVYCTVPLRSNVRGLIFANELGYSNLPHDIDTIDLIYKLFLIGHVRQKLRRVYYKTNDAKVAARYNEMYNEVNDIYATMCSQLRSAKNHYKSKHYITGHFSTVCEVGIDNIILLTERQKELVNHMLTSMPAVDLCYRITYEKLRPSLELLEQQLDELNTLVGCGDSVDEFTRKKQLDTFIPISTRASLESVNASGDSLIAVIDSEQGVLRAATLREYRRMLSTHKHIPKKKLSDVEKLHFFKWLEDNKLSNAGHTKSYGTKELYDELLSISADPEDYYYLRELNRLLYKPTTRS